jgi:hypothetical protein
MTISPSFIGVSLLLATACASSGTTTSAVRPKAGHVESEIPRRSCSAGNTAAAPSHGLITDFSATQPGGVRGNLVVSLPPDSAPGSITHTTEAGNLTLKVNAVPGGKPQVFTASLFFDGCVDARGFSGIQFKLSGSLSGCMLTFASVDPEHQYYRAGGPYPPQTRVAPSSLTSEATTITAPFLHPDTVGNPATPTDASQLAFLQWLVMVPVGADDGTPVPPCTGSIAIDDVKLYR